LIAPLLSKVRTRRAGAVGFHPVIPEIAPRLVKARYVFPFAESVVDAPVLGRRRVHVGEKVALNFVIALSTTLPVTTGPLTRLAESPEIQLRDALRAELLTSEVIDPVLETLINTPSRTPATFLPARVSALDPKIEVLPSEFRATALSSLFEVPIVRSFPKVPVVVAVAK
jgi:hypothetical protein